MRKEFRNAYITTDHGKDSQDDQRNGDRCRAFMQVMLLLMRSPEASTESSSVEAEHIKCSQSGHQIFDAEEDFVVVECSHQNLFPM